MSDASPAPAPSREQVGTLLLGAFVVAACGLSYELMMGAVATTLLGSSVTWYSITIGVFLAAMGLGSWLSRFVHDRLLTVFVAVEIAAGILGGAAGVAVFAAYTATAHVVIVLLAALVIVGALVGLEIPLLTRFLEPYGGLRAAIANVMALDYLGALLASVAFPLVLLPWLGLLQSFFAVGLLNLFVAALTAVVFRREVPLLPLAVVGVLGAGLLGAGFVTAERAMASFESRLYRDQVIVAVQSPYQRIVLTKYQDDVRLYLDGHLQLSSRDEARYHEPLVHPAMALAARHRSVLLLGAGDGMAAREVLRFAGVERVVLVDLDPAMTELAAQHRDLVALNGGSLDDPRVEVVNADAFSWLAESSELFDVVVMDFPDPHDHGLARLYSTAMMGMVARHLTPGGVAVTQATSPYFARQAYWSIVATAEAAGMHTLPFHAYVPSFGEWGFVAMSAAPLAWSAVSPAPWARFATAPQLATMHVFPPDMQRVPAEPSTLQHPVVATYYQRGWTTWF